MTADSRPRPASRTERWLTLCALLCCLISGTASAGALPRNWPLAPSELERRFALGKFEIRESKGAGHGKTGALKVRIAYADGKTLDVKWKTVPPATADGWNNSPRKELAAYEVQKWIFDENDYVVPTVALNCIPIEQARTLDKDAKPTFAGSSCVLGMLAVWMQEANAPKKFYDEERFDSDPLYARTIADLNLLTYIIGHRDTRPGNVLLSTDSADPRAYAVDNGIAFDLLPWNLRVFNWFRIHVPWLRREAVERLRRIDRPRLRALAVVAELEADSSGVFHPVSPGPNLDPDDDDGVRRRGNRVQFGLDHDEIDDMEERIQKLLANVDSGKQPVR